MPDVSRSDSQRSDASLRPRVSFNRDVHVKRIVPSALETSRPVVGALSSDGDGHLINSTVRKERIKKSKKELAEEAAQVLQQADKLNCFTNSDKRYSGSSPEKFYTLPTRRKEKKPKVNYPSASLDRKKVKNRNNNSPEKPPRTFSLNKSDSPVKLKRSASDATNLKRVRPLYETSSISNDVNKKQLSPIIENIQREDYFQKENGINTNDVIISDNEKENSVTTQLKKYIEEVDRQLLEHNQKKNEKKVDVVVIDIDNAEKVSPSHLSKLKKRIKSITSTSAASPKKPQAPQPPSLIQSAKANLQKPQPSKMIHSSQKPADRLPLTKGHTVDRMIKRLNQDAYSPPPRPKVSVQHNNSQPFSYTRGLSPDKSPPVIYAQVVCNNNNNRQKQTVHTVYKSPQHHSDSDEGLGNEDSSLLMRKSRSEKTLTHFGDSESPIKPKYRVIGSSYECLDVFPEKYMETRGRGDGMDAIRRRESLSEDVTDSHLHNENVSARRDLLESRITKRIHHNHTSSSPENFHKYETSHRKLLHKSTPDIVQEYNNEWSSNGGYHQTYHDSLRRENSGNNSSSCKPEKDRFGDSGIENDIRRDSRDFRNGNSTTARRYYSGNDSEDEGFASSLLIASERQHTEENFNSRNKMNQHRKEYDSEDDAYRNLERLDYKTRDYNNVHRERSIDDGSHYDPRIDSKEFRVSSSSTLKRNSESKKPPKPEKKSGLQKVKRLFTRSSDSKKKNKEKASSEMVREGTLRARYTEYKGSREHLEAVEPLKSKREVHENHSEHRYASRRRLSTPSPSSSPTRELEPKRKSDSLQTSWFKSLDRLSRKKNKKENAKPEPSSSSSSNKPTRSLRFFGDTDQDSSDSARHSSTLLRHRISSRDRIRSQSSRELHNISEENANTKNKTLSKRNNHKSMTNISDGQQHHHRTVQRSNLKPPISPSTARRNNVSPMLENTSSKFRKKKYEISSVESSTEGDSSQQSQRSVVYLHAATVGDIPGPVHLKYAKRTGSRDELHEPGRIQPQIKTLSRSFSVLAPWKPRHSHETTNIDYSSSPTLKKQHQVKTTKRSGNSKENLSKYARDTEGQKSGSSTLYKKKGRLPRENSRYNKDSKDAAAAESKKIKSMSVESLRSNGRSSDRVGSHEHKRADISRSISMPKDPEKSAGWFKNNNSNVAINNNKKKSHHNHHHRSDYITQRL